MSFSLLMNTKLGLKIRLWAKSVSAFKLVFIVVAFITLIGCLMIRFGSGRYRDIGVNFVADGIMMFLTIFFIDRLIRAQDSKRFQSMNQLMHKSLLSIHSKALSIWGVLVFTASELDRSTASYDERNAEFDEKIGEEPFSDSSLSAMKKLDKVLKAHELKNIISRDVEVHSKDLKRQIEIFLGRFSSYIEPDLYTFLVQLESSSLLRLGCNLSEMDSYDLGWELTLKNSERRDLFRDIHGDNHLRNEDRPIEYLADEAPQDIQDVFRCLADEIDVLSDTILTRQAYRVPRTLSLDTLLIKWHIYHNRVISKST